MNRQLIKTTTTAAGRWRGSPASTLCVVTVAVFTDTVVYSLVVPILPRYADSLGAGPGAIGFLFASYALALLVTLPLFGVLSDRVGRRLPMLWGLVGLGGATLLFAFADSYGELVAARLLQGIAGAITWTAGLAAVADVYPPDRRGKALGTALSATAAGGLVGPALGGVLSDWGGYRLPFLVVGGLALADGLARAVLLDEPPRQVDEGRPSLRRLIGERSIWVISGIVILGATLFSLMEPVIPPHLEVRLHASSTLIGLLFMGMWLGFGAASPLAGLISDRLGATRCMAIGLALMALVVPGLSLPDHVVIQAILMALTGFAVGVTLAPTLPELANAVDRLGGGSYGSVYALWNEFFAIGMAVGPLVGGLLRESFSVRTTLVVTAVPLMAYAVALLACQPRRSSRLMVLR